MSEEEKKKLEENKAVYRRFLYELYNEAKLDVADEIIADDYEYHDVIFKASQYHKTGPEGVKRRVKGYKIGLPDLVFKDELMIAEGFKGVDILKIVNGKIVDGWDCSDFLTAFRQVGVIKLPWD
jgi:predicted SnoaL-like aldol condensation-catalyzing enzyme